MTSRSVDRTSARPPAPGPDLTGARHVTAARITDAGELGHGNYNERDQAVVRMLIDLAAGLGLSVTAEGVENQAQLDLLRDLRCPFAQGYLLGRPGPLGEALTGLGRRRAP